MEIRYQLIFTLEICDSQNHAKLGLGGKPSLLVLMSMVFWQASLRLKSISDATKCTTSVQRCRVR